MARTENYSLDYEKITYLVGTLIFLAATSWPLIPAYKSGFIQTYNHIVSEMSKPKLEVGKEITDSDAFRTRKSLMEKIESLGERGISLQEITDSIKNGI